MRCLLTLFISLLLGPATALADTPVLQLPLDCVPGESCWIAKYVDQDTTPNSAKDYRCGNHTLDGHKGTDFALQDLRAMHMGVAVRAAAAGIVKGVRNNMEDISSKELKNPSLIKGKECGNGVYIAHEDGWSTQYCHMKRSSVLVMKGQRVEAGQKLGLVGLSGMTEFPHLHFAARKDRVLVDPFSGIGGGECGKNAQPLWEETVLAGFPYGPAIYNIGFAGTAPDPVAVRKGLYRGAPLDKRAPALVLWVDIFGVNKGDEFSITITAPDGELIHQHNSIMPNTKIRRFMYTGRKKNRPFWPEGTYKGVFTLSRPTGDGATQSWSETRTIEIH